MNLLQAISLGGAGAGDFQGNDSTTLICHVQLVMLAVDWILNIVADNLLGDPLAVLIIFICQALLLIIGLIFYLMASANQAMKAGIHEKLLRHHQITVLLWTIYFSTLVCWYIWALKRSWPSAGEHFSFTFTAQNPDGGIIIPATKIPLIATTEEKMNDTLEILTSTFSTSTTPGMVTTTTATSTIQNILSTVVTTNTSTGEESDSEMLAELIPSTAAFIQHEIRKRQDLQIRDVNGNSSVGTQFNETSKEENEEPVKFFWSPGFIAVYVVKRSVSLLLYVAYILGTLHIMNAHLLDDSSSSTGNQNTSSGNTHRNGHKLRKASSYPDSHHHMEAYIESDSNLDDSFVRQLEDQDADPFDNEQYDYQYRINNNDDTRFSPDQDSDSDGKPAAGAEASSRSSETDEGNFGREKRNKTKRSDKKTNKSGMRPGDKTKGALRNIMLSTNFRKSSSNNNNQQPGSSWTQGGTMFEPHSSLSLKADVFSPAEFHKSRGGDEIRVKNNLIPVTTSSSVDTMGTGSTDELLVAEVITREDKNVVRLQGFHNDFGHSEENVYRP